jgi:hypothetical protein|tara:strand:+ start:266 stop:511 length:246 start_codon:yes stop_codon:yes gene_type:complete
MAGAAIKGLGKAYNLYKSRVDAMNRKIKKAGSKRAATESLLDEYSDVMEAKKKGIKTKKQFKQMKKEKAKKTAKEFKGLPK